MYPQVKSRVENQVSRIARAEDKKRKQEERVSNAFAEIAALKRWDIRVGKSKYRSNGSTMTEITKIKDTT